MDIKKKVKKIIDSFRKIEKPETKETFQTAVIITLIITIISLSIVIIDSFIELIIKNIK